MDGPPQPGRIRAARDLRAMTQAEVVEAMVPQLSPAALSQIEAGKVRPSPTTLRELARVLQVPVGFFSAPWPGAVRPGATPPATYFRDLRATKVRQRRQATALALLLHDLLTAIEQYAQLPELDVPVRAVEGDPQPHDIEAAAFAVRRHWGLGLDPIPNVVRELERHGVPVARLTMGTRDVDAFSIRFLRRPLVLLTDDKSNYVRSRFDAAHELGHLILHRGVAPGSKTVENQAHYFAAAFLLPRAVAEDVLPRRLDTRGWSKLLQLKLEWGMSIAALLYRARRLDLLTEEAHKSAMRMMSARGWRTSEPGDRELGRPEAAAMIERALRVAALEAGRTAEDLICDAQLPLDDTLSLVRASSDSRPPVQF